MGFDPDRFLAEVEQPIQTVPLNMGQMNVLPGAPAPFDPDAFLQQVEEPSLTERALGGLQNIGGAALEGAVATGQFIDKFTGAPTRAAIGELQQGIGLPDPTASVDEQLQAQGFTIQDAPQDRGLLESIGETAKTFGKQFGADPTLAPSGKELVETAGVPEGIPSTVAGFLVDVAADPTNVIPVGAALKLAGKGIKGGSKLAVKGSAKAVDIATGARTTETLKGVSRSADNIINLVKKRFNPKLADDFEEMTSIANKNSVDTKLLPEAIEFGNDTVVDRAGRALTEGPAGEERLKKFLTAKGQIDDALDVQIDVISKQRFVDRVDAGKHLLESYNKGIDRVFKDVDFTYKSIGSQVPGLELSEAASKAMNIKLNKISRDAARMVRTGVTSSRRAQGKQLLEAVQKVKGSKSYNQAVDQLQEIGNVAFKKTQQALGDVPVETKEMQKMYFALRDGLTSTVRSNLGDDIANGLQKNNKALSKLFSDNSVLAPVIGRKNISPEAVFKSLIENGDSKKLDALRSILTKEEIAPLKAAFVEGLIKRNADGEVLFASTIKSLQGNKKIKDVMRSLFDSPEELDEIRDLLRLGDRMGNPFLSTSATGSSNAFNRFFDEIKTEVTDEVILQKLKSKARRSSAPKVKPRISKPRRKIAKGLRAIGAQKTSREKEEKKKQKAQGLRKVLNFQKLNI